MQNPLIRRCAAPITGAALVTGVMLVGAPANADTTVTNFTSSCQAKSVLTVDKQVGASMTVDAPASVAPGETFTYRIQPNASSYPNSDSGATTTNLSRLKYDYAIPDNATFVSAAIVPGTAVGLDNTAPNVLRVSEAGAVDNAAGPIVRLSGNNEVIGNGGSNSTNSEGGIRVPKSKKNLDGSTNSAGDTWYQLPAVDITVTAGASGVIQPKVRLAGSASSYGNDQNFSTSLAKASFLGGTQWAPTRCIPSDNKGPLNSGAGPLATITIAASQASTTTTLSAPATAETGAPVTLTANVAPGEATGSVQFQDNGTDIGSPVEVSGGAASLNHTFTSAGSHSITAVFTATGNFTGSTSSAQTVAVSDPAPTDVATTLGLTVPQNAETGTAVDLTANVTPANAQGTVQFKDNGTNIGSPVTVASGAATLSHAFAAAGSHSVTAEFVGATGFTGSTAGAQTVTVADPVVPDTQTTTTVSAPASAVTGAEVTLSATVAPVPTGGTVQFKVAGDAVGAPVNVDGSGHASMPYTFNAAGSYAVTADYSGATGFTASTASAQTVAVSDPAPTDVATTLGLTVPQNAETGTAVDLTANVTPANAQGTVQFKDNGTNIGSPVTVASGAATLSHAFAAAGSHSVTAEFVGATGFTGSTAGAQTVTVADPVVPDTQTTTTVSAPASAVTGAEVTLSATVAPVPTGGTVQFKVAGDAVGAPVNVDGSGHASMPYTFNAAGSYAVTADYSGATGFTASTASAQTVAVSDPTPVDAATTTILNVPGNAKTDEAQDLVATVYDNGTENAIASVGTVQFFDGGASIGSAQVTNGVATLNHTFTTPGTHTITATFSGATGFSGSTADAKQIVVTEPTPVDVETATVVTVPATATAGSQVQLTAKVTGAGDAAVTGTVQFFDGNTPIGDAAQVVNGVATLNHTFTKSGAHNIHAVFSGGQGVADSTSSAQTVQVSGGNSGGFGSLGNLGAILKDLLGGLNFGS
ncbi:beta strand repeat-containing protein [Rhodococcus sp. ACT016]|uniref:beta strand repeat-containing protein n=1 Tax=Rhodococcus sp. ACT016 TaxID=3134808 RepID=UPI003D26DBBF